MYQQQNADGRRQVFAAADRVPEVPNRMRLLWLELWVGAANFPAMKQRRHHHPYYYADLAGRIIILLCLGGVAAIIMIAMRLHATPSVRTDLEATRLGHRFVFDNSYWQPRYFTRDLPPQQRPRNVLAPNADDAGRDDGPAWLKRRWDGRAIPCSLVCPSLGWPSFLDQVQRSFDLHEHAYGFIALVRAGVFLQPFQQPLLSPKEFSDRGHLKEFCDRGHRDESPILSHHF